MVIKRILTDRNLHDVILNLNEFYIQSFFSIKSVTDKQTNKQTNKQTDKPDPPSEINAYGPTIIIGWE